MDVKGLIYELNFEWIENLNFILSISPMMIKSDEKIHLQLLLWKTAFSCYYILSEFKKIVNDEDLTKSNMCVAKFRLHWGRNSYSLRNGIRLERLMFESWRCGQEISSHVCCQLNFVANWVQNSISIQFNWIQEIYLPKITKSYIIKLMHEIR